MIVCFEIEAEDIRNIQALSGQHSLSSLWSIDETKSIRHKIKAYYIGVQRNQCCYCQQKFLTNNLANWQVDHVIPRDSHPAFVFEPRNLAVACADCNIAKSNKQTLVNKNRIRFPDKSSDYKIVHPIFDEYNDHIQKFKVLYFPKSNKGKATIEMCDLLRFSVNFVDWDDDPNDRRFEADVKQLFDGNSREANDALRLFARILED